MRRPLFRYHRKLSVRWKRCVAEGRKAFTDPGTASTALKCRMTVTRDPAAWSNGACRYYGTE